MNKKKLQIWLPVFFALLFVFGVFIGIQLDNNIPLVALQNNTGRSYPATLGHGKVEEILRYINAKYVDDENEEALMQAAIDRVLTELDPHSNYITAKDLKDINEQLEGNFDGIGIEFLIVDDTINVITPIINGPAAAAGIETGDKILKIKNTPVAGVEKKIEDITDLLRGEKGSLVELEVLKQSSRAIKQIKVTRDAIPLKSIDIAYMMEEQIGFIKINRFSASTYEEFMKAVERLVEKEGVKDLIIDVRHNPGGYLQQATNILSQFFTEKGKLLVYTEGRTVKRTEYKTTGRVFFPIRNIAVLIDEGSASASEILAGALQDLDRGIIVGRRSFGKGLVQEQYNLNDGSALRLTVAKYYTPSGRCIQRAYEDLEDYESDALHRKDRGEYSNQDSIKIDDNKPYYTEKGRIVYAGGGIMPDVFVPVDSLTYNNTYLEIRQYVPQYVFRWLERKNDFSKTALAKAAFSKQDYEQFIRYCQEKGVYVEDSMTQVFYPELMHHIEARMAKHLEGDEAFYRTLNQHDDMIQAALKHLKSDVASLLKATK